MRFSANCTSNSWNSISLDIEVYSRLLRTFFCWVLYFFISAFASSILAFFSAIPACKASNSSLNFTCRFLSPSTSSSRSETSKGSSPRVFCSSSIFESMSCKSYKALNFSSTVISTFCAIFTNNI